MMFRANDSTTDVLPLCGIVLAGGDGTRLKHFVWRLRGDDLPKQYVDFIGNGSMLEHAIHRAETLIPPARLFTVVTQSHLQHAEVQRQLSSRVKNTLLVQPENKETLPGILLPLIYLYRDYPKATVVVFPSDHFIVEEKLFIAHVAAACRFVACNPSNLVLLGIQPDSPEADYGYILPGKRVKSFTSLEVHKVWRFVEKPQSHRVPALVREGGLWNTMTMIFRAEMLLNAVRRFNPVLYRTFQEISRAVGTRCLPEVLERAYGNMEPANFSKQLLENFCQPQPSYLSVLPVNGVQWSDWGSEKRIVNTLSRIGKLGRLKSYIEIPAVNELEYSTPAGRAAS